MTTPKKQHYWFKIIFGKWNEGIFDPENSFVFIEAWDASAAVRKSLAQTDLEEGEVVIQVLYVGYPQL